MKAKSGKTYAQILNGKVHWVFTIDELPEWSETHIEVVEIPSGSQRPNEGDLWNGLGFVKAPPPISNKELAVASLKNPANTGLIRVLARRLGVTENQLLSEIEAEIKLL